MKEQRAVPAAARSSDFRPEIQALRAVAVVAVVLFHLWPDRLTGGFVGVDVFFAISGFLITGHLIRENASSAGISLPSFWARRIRRLMPAASTVLLVTLLATVVFLPHRLWQDAAQQVGASAIGLQNWLLAANSVDYFAADNTPTGVQHYWSLSLEEQFYLVWPIAIVLVILAVGRRSSRVRQVALGILMAAIAVASLIYSIVDSSLAPSAAYFSTFTHAWEFALGGLLGLLSPTLMRSRWGGMVKTRAVGTWLGLAAIVAAAFTFTGHSAFPGWIALLPIGGVLLVIAAGASTSRIQRPLFLGSRPVQWIGDWSYSIYLWHWPFIVVLPFALGHPLGAASKVGILVLSIVLGALTKRFIEDPARRAPLLVQRRWVGYAALVVAAGVVVSASGIVWNSAAIAAADGQKAAEKAISAAIEGGDPCFGAAAMTTGGTSCPDSHQVTPKLGPDFAADDWGSIAGVNKDGTLPDVSTTPGKSGCVDFSGTGAGFFDCTMADTGSATTVVVVGDSHALALFEPIERLAQARGWNVRGILRNSCTASLPMHYEKSTAKADCNLWRAETVKRIERDRSIDLVVTTGFTRGGPEAIFRGSDADLVDDYTGAWARWTASGKRVLAIEDVPLTSGQSVPDCVAATGGTDPCTVPRADALKDDPVADAAATNTDSRISFVDLTDALCDKTTCHAVVGGIIAYRDFHHLSATFALTLLPRLDAALKSTGLR